ncbi:hypothetical protein Tco_0197472, partial [Tanacetum coccineum]
GTRIDLRSHKESLEAEKVIEYVFNDEKDKEEIAEAELVRKKRKGSLEISDTPLTTPTRSLGMNRYLWIRMNDTLRIRYT